MASLLPYTYCCQITTLDEPFFLVLVCLNSGHHHVTHTRSRKSVQLSVGSLHRGDRQVFDSVTKGWSVTVMVGSMVQAYMGLEQQLRSVHVLSTSCRQKELDCFLFGDYFPNVAQAGPKLRVLLS